MEGGEGQASQMRHASPEAIHLHIDYADSVDIFARFHAFTICSMSRTQTHTESLDGQDHDEVQKKAKSRRPASKPESPTLGKNSLFESMFDG